MFNRCKKFNQFLTLCFYGVALTMLLLTSACNNGEDPYIYDRIGNDDFRSAPRNNPRTSYQSPPRQQYQQPNPYQQNQNGYAQPHQGYQQNQPLQRPQGGSRQYYNPYDIAPENYNYYYDSDQYYVPPSGYNNVEPQQQQSPFHNPNRDVTTSGY
jgi:hypothetical protein